MKEEKIYCKPIGCPYRFTCDRFFNNNKFEDELIINVTEFEHTMTKCKYYIRKEGK